MWREHLETIPEKFSVGKGGLCVYPTSYTPAGSCSNWAALAETQMTHHFKDNCDLKHASIIAWNTPYKWANE